MSATNREEVQPGTEARKPRRCGPRTAAGKARSRLNALRTGIFAKTVITSEAFGDSCQSYHKLLGEIRESIGPRNRFEEILVENLAVQFLRLTRVYRADASVAPALFEKLRTSLEVDTGEAEIAGILGEKSLVANKLPAGELLLKYENHIWRQIDRILDRLQKHERHTQPEKSQEVM